MEDWNNGILGEGLERVNNKKSRRDITMNNPVRSAGIKGKKQNNPERVELR